MNLLPEASRVNCSRPQAGRQHDSLRKSGGHHDRTVELMRAASPVHRVDAEDPPFFIAHGKADLEILRCSNSLGKKAVFLLSRFVMLDTWMFGCLEFGSRQK